ncbi:MAG TPA: DUF3488 and transglutaminase-like domain-containing protein [Actinomycetota bacterium]|nr:DUF3488 and transglutaminase-like domain-containing protein [Actinomycetota bacterium]
MGSEARARLGLAGLAMITLLTFNQVFAQQDFSGPALLGMMIATGVAVGARRLGLWPSSTVFASVLLMVWYLAAIFQAPHTFYGLPTLESLRRLGISIARAYEHSNVDYAPVPLRPGYAVLTVAAMWIVITVGEVATFRWRRPLLASVGPIALFSLLLVVGTQQGGTIHVIVFLAALFTYWALEASHRLRSWGRWVPVWKGQKAVEPPAITTGLARRMGVSCVAAALVLPIFLPAIEDGLISWRTKTGIGTGTGPGGSGGSSGQINPLVSLVPDLITQTETELFRVTSSEPTYWRLVTLTHFNGVEWSDGSLEERPVPPHGAVELQVRTPDPGRNMTHRVTISGLEGNALPSAGVPLIATGGPAADGNLNVDPVTTDLELESGLFEGFQYNVQAVVPDLTFEEMQTAQLGDLGPRPYLETPDLSPRTRQLARDWTAGARTPFQKLVALQSQLRLFDYSVEIADSGASSDYLDRFLFDTQIGYCQQFATAFAILARELEIPTRVVVGFLPGQTDTATPDQYSVTGTDTHAWPEVFFQGYGWVPFEPTPRGTSPEPIYTVEAVGPGPSTISGAEAPTGGARQDQRGTSPLRGDGSARQDGRPLPSNRPGASGGRINTDWQKTFTRIALTLALLGLLYLALVPALKTAQVRSRYARAKEPRGAAAAAFAELEFEAAGLAMPRARAETASSYARRLAALPGLPAGQLHRLASIYEAAEYAPTAPPPQTAAEAKRLARQLKARLWAQASWWSRLKRLWSPVGLVRRPRPGIRRLALQRILSLGRS